VPKSEFFNVCFIVAAFFLGWHIVVSMDAAKRGTAAESLWDFCGFVGFS
jgi:hypothetical protein